jgi:lactate permease
LRELAQALEWRWRLFGTTDAGGVEGSFAPLYHPGTLLLLAFLLGGLLQGERPAAMMRDARAALAHLAPVALALFIMLTLSRSMLHAGMIDAMADAAAAGLGAGWPLFSPLIGVLGTFVTGSATASNVLFAELQQGTAVTLGLPVPVVLGAQGLGAAVGNMIAPHNIVAGAATVEATGREGEVLRRTVLPCLAYALLGGALSLLLARA